MSIMVIHRGEDWMIPKRYFSFDDSGKPLFVYMSCDGKWYNIVEKEGRYYTITT